VTRALAWVLLATVAGCGDNVGDAAACERGGTHACGEHLRDPDGRAWILRGVNFAGVHKMAPYISSFGPSHYSQLHAWGFRATRLLFPWAAVEPTEGIYDDAYLDYIALHADWAHEAGLAVILDMHQDVYGEGFGFDGAPRWTCDESYYQQFVVQEPWVLNYTDPNVIACFDHLWTNDALQAKFAAMWGHVAERLADMPAIIGFDPLNEPHWGSYPVALFEPDRLQPFYERVIEQVRMHTPWVVFAEPSGSRNLGFATKLAPFDMPDIVYAPHLYDNGAELSGEFDEARREALLATAEDLRADADRLGVPMWIGEYGGIATSPVIGAYMDAAYDGAAQQFAGSMYWSFDKGGGYSLLDEDGRPQADLVRAIARPYPARIAGEPTSWSYDELGRVLEVSWVADTSITEPTVIVVPEIAYPMGFFVECGGCTVEDRDGEVALSGFPAGPASVTISPHG
jgi:endoglycosylceramidase